MKTDSIGNLCSIRNDSKELAGSGRNKGRYIFYTSGKRHTLYVDTFKYDTIGIVIGKGGTPNWHLAEGQFSMSSDCCLLEPKSDEIDIRYLYYYLCARPSSLQRYFKGAGLKHISISDIKSYKVEYPEKPVQNAIVSILYTLDNVIDKREKAVCIFPDVLYNFYMATTKNSDILKTQTVDEIKESIKTGPFGSQLKKEQIKETGDVYVLGIDNITTNYFIKKTKRYISEEELPKYKRYIVKEGDVLVSIMGTVGKSAVIPPDLGLSINTKHLVDITVKKEECNPYYLSYTICHNPVVTAQLDKMKKGAIMSGVNMSDIKKLRLTLPDIKIQNYFELMYKAYYSIFKKMKMEITLLVELRKSLLKRFFIENILPTIAIASAMSEEENSIDYIRKILDSLKNNEIGNASQYDALRNKLYQLIENGYVIQYYNGKENNVTLKVQ